ncbi:MAG: hypothetical protein J4428_04285 [Candidatus Aenigmarchaeota archaeon]|nr:hypothetical protein [Candidatus Aenigmarchaeota archaeon]
MDLLFHIVAGLIISKQFINGYFLLPVIFSLLPDLIGDMPSELYKLKKASKKSFRAFMRDMIKYTRRNYFTRRIDKIFYKSTHNLFAWGISSVFSYFVFPKIFLPLSLAYLSHLFFDSYTHEKEYSLQPFYPLSEFSIGGKSWVTHRRTFMLSWLALGSFILIKRLI